MENQSEQAAQSAQTFNRVEKVILTLAWLTIPFALLTINFFDSFIAHYKRYPLYLGMNLFFALGIFRLFKSDMRKRYLPLSRRAIFIFSLFYFIAAWILLLMLARWFEPFIVFFETGWLTLFFPLLIYWLRPSNPAAGFSLSIGVVVFLIFATEMILFRIDLNPPQKNLPDYSNLYSEDFYPGGQLKPDQNVQAWSYHSPVQWTTNSAGFRSEHEFEKQKPANTLRVSLIGDSFIAGYRTGQAEIVGVQLEEKLNQYLQSQSDPRGAQVLITCAEEQTAASYWLDRYGFEYQPDLVLVAVCLGNDLSQCYVFLQPDGMYQLRKLNDENIEVLRRREPPLVGFHTPPIIDAFLPEDAYNNPGSLYDKLIYPVLFAWQRTHLSIRAFHLIWLFVPPGIHSMYSDSRNRVHLFDNGHGLGFFYKPELEPIQTAWSKWEEIMLGLKRACNAHGTKLGVVLIPQRFTVNEQDWQAAAHRFNLVLEKFDVDLPAKRIVQFCETNGIKALDLTPAMREAAAEQSEPLYMPMGDMHWNDSGQSVAADAIAKWVEEQFLNE